MAACADRCWVGGLLGGRHARRGDDRIDAATKGLGAAAQGGIALTNPPTLWRKVG